MLWLWIVLIVLFSIYFLGAIVFSCLNAKATVKPKILTIDREVDINRRKGLWGDFDSYTKVNYTIEGKDGYVLHATFVDNEEVRGTGKYMIILHGRTSIRYGAVKYLTSYIKLGYSCVIYDARYHGVNVRDVCTLGNYESEDLMKVIEDTRNRYHDIKVLGLHGESMGSSAALIATKFNPEIDFIVADCPFTDCYSVIHRNYRRIHLEYLTPCIRLAAKLIYKVDINDTNALRAVENNKYPILFIHGTGDTFIRPDHSEQLQKAASRNGAYTELVLVEGAGHARSRYVAGFEAYTSYIENFLENIGIESQEDTLWNQTKNHLGNVKITVLNPQAGQQRAINSNI